MCREHLCRHWRKTCVTSHQFRIPELASRRHRSPAVRVAWSGSSRAARRRCRSPTYSRCWYALLPTRGRPSHQPDDACQDLRHQRSGRVCPIVHPALGSKLAQGGASVAIGDGGHECRAVPSGRPVRAWAARAMRPKPTVAESWWGPASASRGDGPFHDACVVLRWGGVRRGSVDVRCRGNRKRPGGGTHGREREHSLRVLHRQALPDHPAQGMPTMGGWKSASMVTCYTVGARARSTMSTGSAGLPFRLELHV